jgi:hypothetical protein
MEREPQEGVARREREMSAVEFPTHGGQDAAKVPPLVQRYRAALEHIEELFRARGEMLLGAAALGVRQREMAEWCGLLQPTISITLRRLRHQGVEPCAVSNPEAEVRAVMEELRAAQREALELRHELHVLLTRLLAEGWTLTQLTVATGLPEWMLRRYCKPYSGRRPPVGSSRGYALR